MNSRETAAVAGSLPSPCRLNAYVRGQRPRAGKPGPRPCTACETIFTPAKENPDRPARFCSDKCRARSWRQRRDNESSRFAAIESRLSALEAAVGKIGTGGAQ